MLVNAGANGLFGKGKEGDTRYDPAWKKRPSAEQGLESMRRPASGVHV